MEINFLAVNQTAKALAQERVDDTELAKVLTYLKATRDERKTRELLGGLPKLQTFTDPDRPKSTLKRSTSSWASISVGI